MRKFQYKQRGFWNFLLPAGLSLLGGLAENESNQDVNESQMRFNSAESAKNRDFQSVEAQKNRDFQDQQSSSVWQRGVKDMEAAGINPMLAYMKGGAPVTSGAQASGSQATSGGMQRMTDVISPAVNSAVNIQQTLASVDKIRAETKNVEADTLVKLVQPANVEAQTTQSIASAGNLYASTQKLSAEFDQVMRATDLLREQIKTEPQRRYNIQAERDLNEMRYHLIQAETDYKRGAITVQSWERELVRAKAIIEALGIKRAQNLSDAEDTEFKRDVSPFLDDAKKITDGLGLKVPNVLPRFRR